MTTILNRQFLMRLRSIIIDLLNVLDDELGLPRTIPAKSERRRCRAVGEYQVE